jgi:nucleoside-diphosphate-sugar epimerase
VAKISAKYTLTLEASMQDMEFIYVLHSHVMGPNDDKDSFLQVLLGKLISREPLILSSGEQMFDVVSLNDCVLGYRLLCERGIPGKNYWVGSGDPRPLREYVERMYRLYPSGQEMQFGRLPYNDIKLSAEDFSIGELQRDTGYAPTMTFEDTVELLRRHLYPNHRVGDK